MRANSSTTRVRLALGATLAVIAALDLVGGLPAFAAETTTPALKGSDAPGTPAPMAGPSADR
jgi:hypothetical protein